MRLALAIVAGIGGAVAGYIGWILLMNLFAFVCRGWANALFCAGLGGPDLLDLITLPVMTLGVAWAAFTAVREGPRTRP